MVWAAEVNVVTGRWTFWMVTEAEGKDRHMKYRHARHWLWASV